MNIGRGSLDFIYKSNYGEYIEKAKNIIEKYEKYIVLPTDLAYVKDKIRCECKCGAVPEDICAADIGTESVQLYKNVILKAKTVFVNEPMGVFEDAETEYGTKTVFESLAETKGFSVVGGGDSVAAASKYGITDKLGYVCTGGGALIRFLTGEELPVVKALRFAAKKFGGEKL